MINNQYVSDIAELPFSQFKQQLRKQYNAVDEYSGYSILQSVIVLQEPKHTSRDIIRKIKYLLRKGADVNYQNNEGRNALHVFFYSYWRPTIEHENKIVDLLLASGVDVNSKDSYTVVPMYYALANNYHTTLENEPIYRKLLQAGADYNYRDQYGKNLFDWCHEIFDRDDVILLIEKYGQYPIDPVDIVPEPWKGPEFDKIQGLPQLVRKPFDEFKDELNQRWNAIRPHNGSSVLQEVVMIKESKLNSSNDLINKLQYLLDHRADVNHQSNDGKTPLQTFFYYNKHPSVTYQNGVTQRLVEQGADLDLQDTLKATAMRYAVTESQLTTLENRETYIMLLEAGADYNIEDNWDKSVVRYCQEMPNRADVFPLLEKYGQYPIDARI